ncbi:amino acid adenylation domain-containing protein [Chitinimonas viridis]|uniref:Amino acid adenylation domain-containing protein n=1 Tax=Chitinimonas viridis TaxID=664880 RepID=A0ABT8B8F4_9NEIS|nr:non-ribosomal peptide synthetase [Chitinimonas viridis]MDN3578325.1 amino acid adenylation domain-containing protein [Chitinimonas viridis]
MTDAIAVINRLNALGVQLRIKDGKLVTRAAQGVITEELGALIRQHRDALLALLIQHESREKHGAPPISAGTQLHYPPSYAQRRLWLLDRMNGVGASYNMPVALRVDGKLDRQAAAQAFQAIIERHSVLRTVYVEQDGEPLCQVREGVQFELGYLELPAGQSQATDLQALMAAECARPFQLATDLLLRATLVRLSEEQHVLLLNMHHIASDGWSMGVLVAEFTQLYAAATHGRAVSLPALAAQYGDYAVWQSAWQAQGGLNRQLDYWRQRLDGIPHLHGVPTDFPRPGMQRYDGAVHASTLDGASTGRFWQLCRETGTTPFIGLQLAFALLLSRWSNEREVVFGTPIANRLRPELEGLIGFFVNTLVLRNTIDASSSFRLALAEAATRIAQDYGNQDVPFDLLVETLNPERSSSHPPLVQIMFAMQNNQSAAVTLDGLALSAVTMPAHTAKFDLTLSVAEHDGGLALQWEYCSALFKAETIARMAAQFELLLQSLVALPDTPLAEIDMLPASERQQLLGQLAGAETTGVRDSVPQVFFEQVKRYPDRPALVDGEQTLSYAELGQRVRQLADVLTQHGLHDEQPVGLYLERGVDMVVAMLAVLLAGAAYVPLDTAAPMERIGLIIEDAGCELLLCSRRTAPFVASLATTMIVGECDGGVSFDAPLVMPAAGDGRRLAYLMYTSGSTGMPKGAMVEQRGIVRLVCAPDYLDITPTDIVAQASSSAFDATTFEVWAALLNGACLCFVPTDTLLDPAALEATLTQQRISILWMTTALFNQTAALRPGMFAGLRCLLFGGEKAETQSINRVVAAGKPRHLLNMYGPTENTTFTTGYEVHAALPHACPIGRPISGTRCYVLGSNQELLPYGAVGELHVGGEGVARGYLNRPELNAEKFLRDPFAAGGTLYRTGDLVRWLADGTLQYLSRMDHQVKIRGFRVELGELEHALLDLGMVSEAMVMVCEHPQKGKYLAAYVVPAQGVQCSAASLRAALQIRLPAYMLPAAIVLMPAMPISANGKVDRHRLPPAESALLADTGQVAVQGALETALASIWCDVLGLTTVGATDSFFELGGNSLLMMRLCSRVRDELGVDAAFAVFLGQPTIRQQAAWLSVQDRQATGRAIEPQPPADDYPLSFSQQRLWFEALLGNSTSYNLPVALKLDGRLDTGALAAALQALVSRHQILRSRYVNRQGVGRQQIAPLSAWSMVQVDLSSHAQPMAVCMLALQREVLQPFDLEQGPVFTATLYRLGDNEHVLLLNMHHIVADGWSMQVISAELVSFYRERVRHETDTAVPPLPIQYTDFAAWQRAQAQDDAATHGLDYWLEALAFVRELPLLPTDAPRHAAASYPLGESSFAMDADTTAALKRIAVEYDTSLFVVLLAIYNLVIADYSKQDSVVVGTDMAGRDHAETERLVGLFVHQLAIATDLRDCSDFPQLLQRTRTNTLEAYGHKHVPVEQIVSALGLERGLSQHPLFQTKLVFQNFPASGEAAMPEITLQRLVLGNRSCKLDLMLTLAEADGGLRGEWEFNADYFKPHTIRALETNLLSMAGQIAAQPGSTLAAVRNTFLQRQRDEIDSLRQRLTGANRLRKPIPSVSSHEGVLP